MEVWTDVVVPVLISLLASSGFWLSLSGVMGRKSAQTKLLIGLAHDRISFLGMRMIEKGWTTRSDYETLHDYLYVPYILLGGNGSAKKIMEEVMSLPIKPDDFHHIEHTTNKTLEKGN